jgi:carboxymethylenebutenolidase
MDRRIIQLYDEYTHAPLERRVFLEKLAVLAGGTAAAYALLPILENNYALAQMVAPDDPSLKSERVTIATPSGDLAAYFVMPAEGGTCGAAVVIHENRTQPAYRRRDAPSRQGRVPGYVDRFALGGTPADQTRPDMTASSTRP